MKDILYKFFSISFSFLYGLLTSFIIIIIYFTSALTSLLIAVLVIFLPYQFFNKISDPINISEKSSKPKMVDLGRDKVHIEDVIKKVEKFENKFGKELTKTEKQRIKRNFYYDSISDVSSRMMYNMNNSENANKSSNPNFITAGIYIVGAIISIVLIVFSIYLTKMSIKNLIKSFQFEPPLNAIMCFDEQIIRTVNEVTSKIGVKKFQKIYLVNDLDISTTFTRKGRVLYLSNFALRFLSKNEIMSIIAHECAHHQNFAMLLNRVDYRLWVVLNDLVDTCTKTYHDSFKYLERMSFAAVLIFKVGLWLSIIAISVPVILNYILYYILMKFLFLITFLLYKINSNYEYYCDFLAYKYYGSNIFKSALIKIIELSICYERLNNIEKTCSLPAIKLAYKNLKIDFPLQVESVMRKQDIEHPSPYKRIKKADAYNNYLFDNSRPLFNDESFQLNNFISTVCEN